MKKRGLSAVIATVLLVSLVLVLAVIVFEYARSFVGERAESAQIESEIRDLCAEADFSVDDACVRDQTAEDLQGGTVTGLKSIEFTAGNDNINLELHSFNVFVDYTGGTFSIPSLDLSQISGFNSSEVKSNYFDFGGEVLQVRIVPKISSGGVIFTCENKEIVISPIEKCA